MENGSFVPFFLTTFVRLRKRFVYIHLPAAKALSEHKLLRYWYYETGREGLA